MLEFRLLQDLPSNTSVIMATNQGAVPVITQSLNMCSLPTFKTQESGAIWPVFVSFSCSSGLFLLFSGQHNTNAPCMNVKHAATEKDHEQFPQPPTKTKLNSHVCAWRSSRRRRTWCDPDAGRYPQWWSLRTLPKLRSDPLRCRVLWAPGALQSTGTKVRQNIENKERTAPPGLILTTEKVELKMTTHIPHTLGQYLKHAQPQSLSLHRYNVSISVTSWPIMPENDSVLFNDFLMCE